MRLLVVAVLCSLVAYLGVTSYAGYRVGSAIASSKKNTLIAIGERLVGRDAIERYAVRKSNLPAYITQAPTFWMALRATE